MFVDKLGKLPIAVSSVGLRVFADVYYLTRELISIRDRICFNFCFIQQDIIKCLHSH